MNIPLFQTSYWRSIKNEAKFVGGCSGHLFELEIPLGNQVQVRKFSKLIKSRDFNFCQTDIISCPNLDINDAHF